MSKQLERIFRWVCAGLALLLVLQIVRLGLAPDPLAGVSWDEVASHSEPAQSTAKKKGEAKRDVPPAIRARIEAIKNSEVFGPIPRPLPMALLGIAGPDAFIRTPSGQTGLLRENEELGGVKLLKIGTNRVLVEHEGKRTELMLFAGLGGESLLSKEQTK